jgi:putative oxidoreductase
MAIVLGASLVPTTIAGHAYWEISDEPDRTQQKIHFLKNAGLIGGLMFAALDTGGRPSIFWSGRKAAAGFKDSLASASHSVLDAADR